MAKQMWQAFDGAVFETETECNDYEKKVIDVRKEDFILHMQEVFSDKSSHNKIELFNWYDILCFLSDDIGIETLLEYVKLKRLGVKF